MNISFLIALCTGVLAAGETPAAKVPRIVFMGDSITDGHTYPLLIEQALKEAKLSVPVCINAGVAGDTAKGMRKRLERDVLAHKPDLVTLSVGINDVLHKVKLDEFETDVTAIAARLLKEKVPLLILTTTILGPKHAEADKKLDDYNTVLRRLAKDLGLKAAEVNAAMRKGRGEGADLLEEDQVHLNFAGYRVMARAILDALGHKDVEVPAALKLEVMPGVLANWRIRALGELRSPLDEKTVAALKPDDSWKDLILPEKEAISAWWQDQERQRGFAQSLRKLAGPAKSYVAVATVTSEKRRQVVFHTGAQLQSVWLNGKRIFQSDGWTGWHAGKERVPATLEAGKNVIVIESGEAFFLSMTAVMNVE